MRLTRNVGRNAASPQWSPDGRWIVFDSQNQEGYSDIYIIEATGGQPRRLTADPSENGLPNWSRDGKWIYFHSDRTGRTEIWRIPSAGGPTEKVTENGGYKSHESIDGKTLYYMKGPVIAAICQGFERGAGKAIAGKNRV